MILLLAISNESRLLSYCHLSSRITWLNFRSSFGSGQRAGTLGIHGNEPVQPTGSAFPVAPLSESLVSVMEAEAARQSLVIVVSIHLFKMLIDLGGTHKCKCKQLMAISGSSLSFWFAILTGFNPCWQRQNLHPHQLHQLHQPEEKAHVPTNSGRFRSLRLLVAYSFVVKFYESKWTNGCVTIFIL